jgi:hypothetical protein
LELGAQVAAQRQAVGVGQVEVEHHQVDGVALQRLRHLAAVPGGDRVEPILRQVVHQQAADLRVVVDDEDVVEAVHVLLYTSCVGRFVTQRNRPPRRNAAMQISGWPQCGAYRIGVKYVHRENRRTA